MWRSQVLERHSDGFAAGLLPVDRRAGAEIGGDDGIGTSASKRESRPAETAWLLASVTKSMLHY
jgi:hypothetical protein